MSDTPRTDANLGLFSQHCGFYIDESGEHVTAGFARQLERELINAETCVKLWHERWLEMQAQRDRLVDALKMIEEHYTDGDDTYEDWKSMGRIARQTLDELEEGIL